MKDPELKELIAMLELAAEQESTFNMRVMVKAATSAAKMMYDNERDPPNNGGLDPEIVEALSVLVDLLKPAGNDGLKPVIDTSEPIQRGKSEAPKRPETAPESDVRDPPNKNEHSLAGRNHEMGGPPGSTGVRTDTSGNFAVGDEYGTAPIDILGVVGAITGRSDYGKRGVEPPTDKMLAEAGVQMPPGHTGELAATTQQRLSEIKVEDNE